MMLEIPVKVLSSKALTFTGILALLNVGTGSNISSPPVIVKEVRSISVKESSCSIQVWDKQENLSLKQLTQLFQITGGLEGW